MTNSSLATSHGGDQPTLDLTKAPLPTKRTLASRMSIPRQFARFVAFDLRIMRMVIKGHKG